ncbi:MAG: helix-turn-helix transcriptional regulator [Nitrospira sp.]|nr:helix-turn-helix transcriptional regulator [Nitrospira sp.]
MPFTDKKTFFEGIRDKSVRHEIAYENIIEGLAFQIAALRKARGWTEQDLAGRCGVHQKVIEKWEDPNRSKKTFVPFLRLAEAFDVAFISRFAAFGEVADWFANLSPKKLAPPSYEEERLHVFLVDAVGSNDLAEKTPVPYLTGGSAVAHRYPYDSAVLVSADDISGAWKVSSDPRTSKRHEANNLSDKMVA